MLPKDMKQTVNVHRASFQSDIRDLEQIDQKVKFGIINIKERLKMAKDGNCRDCKVVEKECDRRGEEVLSKSKEIDALQREINQLKRTNRTQITPRKSKL